MTSEDERRVLRDAIDVLRLRDPSVAAILADLASPESRLIAEASCLIHQIECGKEPDHGPYRHEGLARELVGVLRELGHGIVPRGAGPRVGPNPDLIDRDGDRWWEMVPGGYSMDVYRSQVPTGKADHQPVARSTIEHNAGPLIEVPRCLDRGPVRVAGPVRA